MWFLIKAHLCDIISLHRTRLLCRQLLWKSDLSSDTAMHPSVRVAVATVLITHSRLVMMLCVLVLMSLGSGGLVKLESLGLVACDLFSSSMFDFEVFCYPPHIPQSWFLFCVLFLTVLHSDRQSRQRLLARLAASA